MAGNDINKIENYKSQLTLEVENDRIVFLTNNNTESSSTIALNTFSGYMTFSGQMAESFGKLPSVNLIFSVVNGVVTGVFDANLNPQKDYIDIIGIQLVSYESSSAGAFLGGLIGGSIGAVVGGVSSGYLIDITKSIIETGRENISFSTGKIEGTITKEEFLIKLHNEDPNYILKVFPEYIRYHQKIEIKSFDEKDTLVGKLNYDKNTDIVTFEKIDETTNEKIVYSVDTNNNNNLTPEYKTNITTGATVLLKSGQTISHVALNTKYTTKELLQYNGLTEEQAKNLPVGFVVKIPKDVDNVQGGYGNVKVYEGQDGSLTYHIPSDDKGNIKIISIDKDKFFSYFKNSY